MRQIRLLALCVMSALLSSCDDMKFNEDFGSEEQGSVCLKLSVDDGTVTTRNDGDKDEPQIDINQFWVEIYKKKSGNIESDIRLYRAQYSEARAASIPLNAGDYYLRAKLGDSLGVGFTKPFYIAEEDFTVLPQTQETVIARASLANVKVTVNFGENFTEYYPDYYARVRHADPKIKSVLKFRKDEIRSGYIHHGEILVEICADFKGDGNWRYYVLNEIDSDGDGVPEPLKYSPNDHITFNIDADVLYGNDVTVNIMLNDETIAQSKTVVVPEYVAPQDAPKVSRQGFDEQGACYVYENREVEYMEGQSFSYNAKAGMKSCILYVDSEYLMEEYDIPSEIELVGMDAEMATRLEKAGIRAGIDKFMGVVDFTDAMKLLGMNVVYKDASTPCAEFSMKVTDVADKIGEIDGRMLVWPELQGSLMIGEGNVWATEVVSPVFTATKGYPENCQLQFSLDGKKWETIETSGSVSGSDVTFNGKDGLKPATSYWFRAVDRGYAASEAVKVTTEDALQLGNPSFEDFRIQYFDFKYKTMVWEGWFPSIVTKRAKRIWYDLYDDSSSSDETRWAVNSTASMDADVTPEYLYYKCYPTVTVQNDAPYDGSYCIMVASVAIDDMGSEILNGSAVTGEVFIGTADNSGEKRGGHINEGYSFTSRPAALTYMHRFSCHNGDPYYAEVQVWDSDGIVIGRGVKDDQTESVEPDWEKVVIPIEYTVHDRKAAYIYVIFRSSATDSTSSRKFSGNKSNNQYNTHVEPSGNTFVSAANDPIHAGNILWLDNVWLEY